MSIAPLNSDNTEEIDTANIDAGKIDVPPESRFMDDDDFQPVKKKRKRQSTSHLKDVPETLELREKIKAAAEVYSKKIDHSRIIQKDEMEQHSRNLLLEMDLPDRFLGFAMVLIGNFIWKRNFLATPFEKRLLLLPHCLKHADGCPAEYDEFGLDCERCGACSIADYKVKAEQLGYKVLVAEGSPVVLKIIISGYVDAILGVACLNVLEKAIDKVLIAGVPSYAIPLHSGDCKNTSLDEAWIWEVIDKYEPLEKQLASGYVPLFRSANRLFEKEMDELLPRTRSKTVESAQSAIGKTENIAHDWLANGGKRFRPFITLAAYQAVAGNNSSENLISNSTEGSYIQFPAAVKKLAIAIEAFHKASLVHDDIQDDDKFRYGSETVHQKHGIGPAINVGDYLIGLGYRLIHEASRDLGPEVACDVLAKMSDAHIKLCDGQGAEMAWQESKDLSLTPIDALHIYALKTSPAFEAALFSGLRAAGPIDQYEETISLFARHIGVGFQILNDLKDWSGDSNNKMVAGQDALALRPTILLALAFQYASDTQKKTLNQLYHDDFKDSEKVTKLSQIFHDLGVFEKAESLVEKSRARAEELAESIEPFELKQLLQFFIHSVLAPEETKKEKSPDLVQLPII